LLAVDETLMNRPFSPASLARAWQGREGPARKQCSKDVCVGYGAEVIQRLVQNRSGSPTSVVDDLAEGPRSERRMNRLDLRVDGRLVANSSR
jgi:hypothetical protein